MNELNFLIGNYDINKISYVEEKNFEKIIIGFNWVVDCGCFSYNKESFLTIISPTDFIQHIINNTNNQTGKIFQLIKCHKDYNGELIDLRGGIDD